MRLRELPPPHHETGTSAAAMAPSSLRRRWRENGSRSSILPAAELTVVTVVGE
jgi:hypothetical protein